MASHPRKIGTVQTVDVRTGKVIAEKKNAFTVLPCAPDVCQECAVDHAHDQPHDKQSLYYQMRFHGIHGRWPTWTDAMAHCTPEVKVAWREGLIEQHRKHGLPVPKDLLTE
jgi:hypothetical protein